MNARIAPHFCAILLLLFAWTENASAQNTADPNLALGKPVVSSGALWPGFVNAALTDGNVLTIAHPAQDAGTLGFYFEIDLGATYHLDRILLRNRSDGCCPERLTNFDVQLYDDNGDGGAGALLWSARIRPDGSNSGVAGVDVISSTNNPVQPFKGRFIRVVNASGAAYNPQMAEVEAYGALVPRIALFEAEPDTIASGQTATLRWQISGASGASITPQVGAISLTNGFALVQPSATTEYILTATNSAGAATARLHVGVDVTLQPPQITEFMAFNDGLIKDRDGDSSDWIEIFNPNDYSLNLSGFFLSDSASNPFQWAFPATRIPRQGYLIVFASGKDRRVPGQELHTNFKLSADGDFLSLADATHRLQQFPASYPNPKNFPNQLPNVSYGLGSNAQTGFLRPATPGGANGAAYAGIVGDLQFSQPHGFYDSNFSLTLTCPTPGATIRFTTNATAPTANTGALYTGPIPISQTTVLRAAAFRDGWAPAGPVTRTYLFLSNVIAAPVMNTAITKNPTYAPSIRAGLLDIPTLSVATPETINGDAEVKMSLEWLSPDGAPGFQVDAGVRNYGGAFENFAKKSFRLYFRSDYGAAKLKYPVFAGFDRGLAPAEEFDSLELRNCSQDMVERGFYMANIFTDDTLLEMGNLNPHGRFVHLYLNGAYWGLYHLRERWNAAMHESYLGGARTNYESINGNWNVGGWADPGSPYDGDGSVWTHIKELRGDYAAIKPWLDVPEYVDYMTMWMFGGSEDEYRAVGPNVPGSGFKFYLNDADGWFCIPSYCEAGDRTARGAPGRLAADGPGSIFSMLVREGHPDYRALLADRMHRALFGDGALTPARNQARLRARCAEISRAFIAESARWNYLSPADWASRRDYALTNWLPRRPTEALAQFTAAGFYPSIPAPVLNQQGGLVAPGFAPRFTAPSSGAIYFTTNGSDPRLPGGAISPDAFQYSRTNSQEALISAGARWRWFTDAAGLGSSAITNGADAWSAANWKHPGFNDAAWSEGPAQFGYGEGDEATVIPYGSDPNHRWITSYYRRAFAVSNVGAITNLLLRLKRDDGAIVYLNGREICRSAITSGAVTGATLADIAPDDGQTFNEFNVPPANLLDGTNLLAVEIHQATASSPDVSFDLELLASRAESANASGLPSLTKNTVIKARAKSGADWSALNEAFFQVGADAVSSADLAIMKLNPLPADQDGSEFIELGNRGGRAINLRGAHFADGIDFLFPTNRDTLLAPGQRLILVKDLFRFQRRFGLEIPVAGIYHGGLSASGEQILLQDQANNPLLAFHYQTNDPWPVTTNSTGHYLVLAHPWLGLDNPAAWRTSLSPLENPAVSDQTVFIGQPTDDRDGDGLPALLEYALGSSDADPQSGPGAFGVSWNSLGEFAIQIHRNLRADDVELSVDFSQDLINWFPGQLGSTRTQDDGLALETWKPPFQSGTSQFARLRATLY